MAVRTTLENAPPPPRISRMAIACLVFGIVSLPLFFLVIPGIIALVFAWTAGFHLRKTPASIGGQVFLIAGRRLAWTSSVLGVLFLLLVPSLGKTHGNYSRTRCAANMRGIMQSCNIYAADNNDVFPLVPYAPYTPSLNNPSASTGTISASSTMSGMFASPPANVTGSAVASLWLLVLNAQVAPKQFICRADPFTSPTAAPVTVGGLYQTNFENGTQLSYSFAYPWTADGRRGGWWRALTDSTLPLISDMSPLQGTGTPARTLNPAKTPRDGKTWNSANHEGDGQFVGYSDVHASFERTPAVGQFNDNIFTTSGTGLPRQFGGTPATPLFPPIPALPASPGSAEYNGPFDILMAPVRNATTGAM